MLVWSLSLYNTIEFKVSFFYAKSRTCSFIGDNINYHILKTTYYEADPNDVTGLNVDALGVLFNPETAVSCETMKIQEWDAALYKTKEHCYLCWTYSPEVSYVLEYNPEAVSDDEIIMMAESAEPYEEK